MSLSFLEGNLRLPVLETPTLLSHRQAVALAVTAYTCWVLVDTTLKLAGASTLPLPELLAILGIATCAAMAAWSVPRGRARALWPNRPGAQTVRALLDFGNALCVVIALRHLPLSVFYVLVFCSPLVTTLMAAAFLAEPLKLRQLLAIIAGFAGVVLAVMPLGARHPGQLRGYLACLVCVLCFSTSIVWSRRLTQTETRESLTFYSGVVMTVGGLAGMAFGTAPVTLRLVALLGAGGVLGVLGSLSFFTALKSSTAANVSQYHYSQLVVGALLAYVIWHDRPTPTLLAGAAIIIASGLYTAKAVNA